MSLEVRESLWISFKSSGASFATDAASKLVNIQQLRLKERKKLDSLVLAGHTEAQESR